MDRREPGLVPLTDSFVDLSLVCGGGKAVIVKAEVADSPVISTSSPTPTTANTETIFLSSLLI